MTSERLFVYGTLRKEGSNAAVLRKLGIDAGIPAHIPAEHGWALVARHNAAYPYVVEAVANGFVPSPITGEIVTVPHARWAQLDAFEDTTWEYRRQRLQLGAHHLCCYVGHSDARALWGDCIASGDWLAFLAGRPAPHL